MTIGIAKETESLTMKLGGRLDTTTAPELEKAFEENMDVCDLSDEELEDELEVFKLPDGRYLIVEG